MQYELFYGNGGHGGPYHTLEHAMKRAADMLRGCRSETIIYIKPRTAGGIGGYGDPVGHVHKVSEGIYYKLHGTEVYGIQ